MTAIADKKDQPERTVDAFRGFTACLTRAQEKGVIYGAGARSKGDIKKSPTMVRRMKWERISSDVVIGSRAFQR